MARQWRIEYEGALYHVLSRGNERKDIFSGDQDRIRFLETLEEMSDRFEIDIFAYVLMGNHYHLLLKTNRANLSKSMQWFGATYTKRFNLRHLRCGHLFQGRFKNMIVQNDAYLIQLSYYIHRNPLRAKMVKRLADYKWSSYPVYAYGRKHPKWLVTETILSQMNVSKNERHKAYRQRVQKYAKEENLIWEDLRHGVFLGTKKFVDRIKSKYLPDPPHQEMPQQKKLRKDTDPGVIVHKAARILKCDVNVFHNSSRILADDKNNRDLLVYLIRQTGLFTNQQIGDIFGLTYSAVSRRAGIVRDRILEDKVFKKKFDRIKSQIKV
jgi:REP element-mobilizing transposase RayT